MILNIAVVTLLVMVGYMLPVLFSFDEKEKKNLRLLWFYHLLFGVIFYFYIVGQGGSDSTRYWFENRMLNGEEAFQYLISGKSTDANIALNFIPSKVMNLSYFTGNIIYCLIGYIGFICFYQITLKYVPYNIKLFGVPIFPIIFFLPNLHFWSCNVGKDTLSFFAIGIFAYAIINLKKRFLLIVLSLMVLFLVRAHIALFLLLGYALAYLSARTLQLYQKVFISIIMIAGAIVVLPKVLEITQIDNLSVDSYEQFATTKSSNLSRARTGSSIDISSYPLPIKVFSFLFRPTIIDVDSAISLVAAAENVLLLILFVKAIKKNIIVTFRKSPLVIKGLLIFLILGSLTFSAILGNLGIMIRMRNMFLPGLLIYMLWSYSFNASLELSRIINKK